MMARELPEAVTSRRAIVYVRQSTGVQVRENLESQRRQYALVDLAKEYGFTEVVVIDEDLGISASGTADRPGFRNMVGQICEGTVGAVLCLEASRLARNGRDWHHLLELCGLVGARVIDADGAHDPSLPNDRLLLGLKGTMSDFELTVLRRRLLEAAIAKARRGSFACLFRLDTYGPERPGSSWTQTHGRRMPFEQCLSCSIALGALDRCFFISTRSHFCFRAPSTQSRAWVARSSGGGQRIEVLSVC